MKLYKMYKQSILFIFYQSALCSEIIFDLPWDQKALAFLLVQRYQLLPSHLYSRIWAKRKLIEPIRSLKMISFWYAHKQYELSERFHFLKFSCVNNKIKILPFCPMNPLLPVGPGKPIKAFCYDYSFYSWMNYAIRHGTLTFITKFTNVSRVT